MSMVLQRSGGMKVALALMAGLVALLAFGAAASANHKNNDKNPSEMRDCAFNGYDDYGFKDTLECIKWVRGDLKKDPRNNNIGVPNAGGGAPQSQGDFSWMMGLVGVSGLVVTGFGLSKWNRRSRQIGG